MPQLEVPGFTRLNRGKACDGNLGGNVIAGATGWGIAQANESALAIEYA